MYLEFDGSKTLRGAEQIDFKKTPPMASIAGTILLGHVCLLLKKGSFDCVFCSPSVMKPRLSRLPMDLKGSMPKSRASLSLSL